MKKSFIVLLALVLALAFLTACDDGLLQTLQDLASPTEPQQADLPQFELPQIEAPQPKPTTPANPTPEAPQPTSTPSKSEPLSTSSLTDAEIAEAFLQILLAEGNPTFYDFGAISNGVISVSIIDLDDDGIPELVFSRFVGATYRYDLFVYGFINGILEELIKIEGIQVRASSPSFSAHSLYGGGLLAYGDNGGCCGGWREFFTYRDLNAVPTKVYFHRTWGDGCCYDNDAFYINDTSVSEDEYYSKGNLLESERIYFLTGCDWAAEHSALPNLSMTYDEAIAYLTQYTATPPTLGGNDNNEPDNDDYILPFSNTRLLTDADLIGLSSDQLRIARNEIFARHGRLFNDPALSDWFMARAWYRDIQPKFTPAEFDALRPNPLSAIESANVDIITARESIVN